MAPAASSKEQVFDLVCIGFGASALSAAVALKERQLIANTLFLEQQPQSTWKPTHNLAAEHMKTSFLNDLITSENPRSKFTFINYLHATNQLVVYTNMAKIEPARSMFADYLRWCASHFQKNVAFGKRVIGVTVTKSATGVVESWNVLFEDISTKQKGLITTKQVVCAVGLQQKIPDVLSSPSIGKLVVHSSEALEAIPAVLKSGAAKQRFAIIGNGQDAADIFEHLHGIRGDHEVHWLIKETSLRGADETPFAIEGVRKSTVPAEFRRKVLQPANSGLPEASIPRQLLTSIYEFMYDQSVKQPNPLKSRFQIRYQTQVLRCEAAQEGKVKLSLQEGDNEVTDHDTGLYDLVISATGYGRGEHERILGPLQELLDGHTITVGGDYQVNFRSGLKRKDTGIWLLLPHAGTPDIDDSLYQVLAPRSARLAQSLLAQRKLSETQSESEDRSAHL